MYFSEFIAHTHLRRCVQGGPPPADEPGKGETQEERKPTSSSSFELSRDGARSKVRETIAVVDRWYDSDDWKPWSPPTPEEEVRNRYNPDAMRSEIAKNEGTFWNIVN